MTKEKDGKKTYKFVSPPKPSITPEDSKDLKDFTKAIFDPKLQDEFDEFLKGTVSVIGSKVEEDEGKISVSLRELTSHENPAISNVSALYGIFNPETIPVTTYDLMKEDPTISAGLAFIKLPIFALPWRVECDNGNIKAFVEEALKMVWRKLLRSLLTSVDYGFSSHEKVFEIRDMKVVKTRPDGKAIKQFDGRALVYKRFKSHHPSSISVRLDKNGNFDGINQSRFNGVDVNLKKYKCFFFTHNEEFGNIFGRSRLKPAYKYWYWKEIIYNFMLMYYERRGSPPIIAHAPPGQSKSSSGTRIDNLQSALDMASSILSNSVAVVPYEQAKNGNDNMWGMEYLTDDKRGEMFIAAIDHLDIAILRALWIPERAITQSGSSGSYSMASVHADLFLMAELGLVNDIEAAVDEQIIPILVQSNFKPEDRAPCYFKMDSMDWNRKTALKDIFVEMIRNIDTMIQSGLKPRKLPSFEEMAKILQIPIEDFETEVEMPDSDENNKTKINPDQQDVDNGDNNTNIVSMNKNLPPKKRRVSIPKGTRDNDRSDIRPGGRRADQIRARMHELFDDVDNAGGIKEIFAPTPDEHGNITPAERLRSDMVIKAQSLEGLHEVKKGLARIKIWSGVELIQNFDLMGFWEIFRHLALLPPHYVEMLHEAMNRQLSEE